MTTEPDLTGDHNPQDDVEEIFEDPNSPDTEEHDQTPYPDVDLEPDEDEDEEEEV